MLLTATLRERLETAWARTDRVFGSLRPAAYEERPAPTDPPLIAFLGALPGYAWRQVGQLVLGAEPIDPALEDLYCRGVDGLGDARRWPRVEQVAAWRERVRDAVREAFDSLPGLAPDHGLVRGGRVFSAVLEHELLAHERLAALLAELDPRLWRRPDDLPEPSFASGASRLPVSVGAGLALLGERPERLAFGWDEEFPPRAVEVPAFEIDSTPVTNGEMLDFVLSGGYADRALWSGEGWDWLRAGGRAHPRGWRRRGESWTLLTLHGELPLTRAFDWPACVSWVEACAFARREGRRLPTEAEFHRAAYDDGAGGARSWPWGEALPSFRHGNFDWKHCSPTPVGSHGAGASAWGVHDLLGNGWEWTSTPFAPLPGCIRTMPDTPGPGADAGPGTHQVMLGGSWATDRDLLRRSFRNAGRRCDPFVLSSFRCVTEL